jgi:hypothetical protein
MHFVKRRAFTDLIKHSGKTIQTSTEQHISLDKSGYFSNAPVTIDNQANQIVQQVLETGRISLKDEAINFKSADLSVIKELGTDTLQADLGETKIYGNDQILLEDVDPKNIPADKDIIFWGKKAKVFAIGKPCESSEGRNVERQIFHEEKQTFSAKLTWKSYVKGLIFLPFAYFIAVYLEVAREYVYVQGFYAALDRENMELLEQLKSTPEDTIKTQKQLSKFYPN